MSGGARAFTVFDSYGRFEAAGRRAFSRFRVASVHRLFIGGLRNHLTVLRAVCRLRTSNPGLVADGLNLVLTTFGPSVSGQYSEFDATPGQARYEFAREHFLGIKSLQTIGQLKRQARSPPHHPPPSTCLLQLPV